MLLGEYKHSIDKKGRMFIPAKLREDLGESFVISKGIDQKPCLCIYSVDEWNELDEKIRRLPTMKAGKLRRFLYSGANKIECDTQGRALIPQNLREYADLTAEATILGMSNHLEIWNSDLWIRESEQYTSESIAEIVEELDF